VALERTPLPTDSLRFAFYELAVSSLLENVVEHCEHSSSQWFKYEMGLQCGRSAEGESQASHHKHKNFSFSTENVRYGAVWILDRCNNGVLKSLSRR